MTSLARIDAEGAETSQSGYDVRDYVPFILRAMANRETSQRKLALKSGITKTRLALLLHSDPAKRCSMTLGEFLRILEALDIDLLQAIIEVETFREFELLHDKRYETLIMMLCEVFKGLPRKVIEALEEIDGIDGSEVRKEWAGPVQRAVVKRLTDEVSAILRRRMLFAESDEFRI